ncbi:hypothetical protein HOT02_gp021 [Staphylococcus phage phiSA_BS2]|uniref:Uncharacterized protein n=1 Tax=Staphylococcus phage phiSA_BS2 TaxID=2126724 RepID=A0A2R3ZXI6_9CAUD|nr:hypothetical protein HOT02_gp021 [Staphylococcus phage phiSA_BS2]AVR55466.1 hypothetical protein phiSABS2_21 [Staphylococcus phage phiSA_BS2]
MKDQLASYFLAKKGKYLVLENGERVKLTQVEVVRGGIDLLFLYNNEYTIIHYYTGRKDQIRMNIPKGLHYTNVVVFESLDGIGILLDRILCNWVEQERETIKGLNWEE